MIRFVADENLNNDIIRGMRLSEADVDIVRVQDVGLYGAPDPDILEWAAQTRRILLTHDVSTIPQHAYDRVRAGEPMPGVVLVPWDMAIGRAIEDILLVCEYSLEDEWEGQILYLPILD